LKVCADAGYDGVELVCTAGWPCDPETLSKLDVRSIRAALDDLGLSMPCLMENLKLSNDARIKRKNLDRLKAAADFAHQVSPAKQPLIETVLGGKFNQWEAVKGEMAAALRGWAKVGEETKTIIAVKAHIGGALHTPDGAKWLIGEVASPWIRLNYDYSHYQLAGFELAKSLTTSLPHTVFIHVKDKRGKKGDFQFLLPGDGDIDYEKYFDILQTSGYRGAVCIEVSGQIHGKPGYDPVHAAKHSYANLAPLFKKTGLGRSGGRS